MASSSSITLPTLRGFLFRSQFLGKSPITPRPHKSPFPVAKQPKKAFYAKFDPFEILGGRGLCNGEKGIEVERKINVEETSSDSTPIVETSDGTLIPVPEDAFGKEMMGLTGGFPGGVLFEGGNWKN